MQDVNFFRGTDWRVIGLKLKGLLVEIFLWISIAGAIFHSRDTTAEAQKFRIITVRKSGDKDKV